MRRVAAVLALLLASACPPAGAASTWLCSLSPELTRLICLTEPDPLDEAPPAPAPATTAVVNGTRFPLDPARVYTVDFWAPVIEPERAEQLAQATICYRSPGCEVLFTAPALWSSRAAPAPRRTAARRH